MDALQSFLNSVQNFLLEPLKANQSKLSWQKELRDSKRYSEVETKLAAFFHNYKMIKDDLMQSDKVIEAIRVIHATRMTQFLEQGRSMSIEESDEIREVLKPYLGLLEHVDGIRRLQSAMVAQGKLKKMPLPYNELNASLDDIKSLAEKMPQLLMHSMSHMSDKLEKVA